MRNVKDLKNTAKKIAGGEAAGDFLQGEERGGYVFFSSWNLPCQEHRLQKVSVASRTPET